MLHLETKKRSLILAPKPLFSLSICVLMFIINIILSNVVLAQRTVIIEPDNFPAQVGEINRVIESDTTSTGERVDESTVYILKRDGVYWFDGTLISRGYHLRIEAEEGEGHPPVLRPAVDLTGSSSPLFRPYADFTIRGLYLSHITDQGGLEKNTIRLSGENSRVVIDNCWLDYDEQSWVRIDNSNISLHLTNNIGRNNGRNDGSGNGRILDTRGIETDTIVVENNTFYNLQGNGIRSGGGVVNYFKFNHNTLVDIAGSFDLGKTIELEFTNNLFTNIGHRGIPYSTDGTTNTGIILFNSVDEIEGISDSDRSLLMANNNFERKTDELFFEGYGFLMGPYRTEIQSIFDSTPDSVVNNRTFLDTTAIALQDLGVLVLQDNIVEGEENLSFVDRSSFQNVYEFWEHRYYTPDDINFPLMWDNPDTRVEGSSVNDWRDFSYSTTSESYTAAQGGFPLGDLNWFPSKKTEWEGLQTVSNEEEIGIKGFKLFQNYPNPFNPSTQISFELSSATNVSLEIFDSLGRKVATLVNANYAAGTHSVSFDASKLSSGLYIARVQYGSGQSSLIKMTLIK